MADVETIWSLGYRQLRYYPRERFPAVAQRSCLISTDTATICIFDLTAMQHRKDDVGDWWSIPRDREMEIVNRSALFLDVGDDGSYQVEIEQNPAERTSDFCLSSPSGRVFVGPGEEMSGAGFEPTGEWGGIFIPVDGPYQRVSVVRRLNTIHVNMAPTEPFENEVVESVQLREG